MYDEIKIEDCDEKLSDGPLWRAYDQEVSSKSFPFENFLDR